MRLEILILITEFGLSCYQAAKVLDLPYTNAKLIYRVFRDENRIISAKQRFVKGGPQELSDMFMLKNAYLMRRNAVKKLFAAMTNGSMTESQRSKIYDHNFDEFLGKPVMAELQQDGLSFLGDRLKSENNGAYVALPVPGNFDWSTTQEGGDKHSPFFEPCALDKDE